MKTTVLVFHPDLKQGSRVNLELANAAKDADITVRDMYSLYPNRVIDVQAEQKVLADADRIVLQFPMFWYSSPALLKQWEDQVLEHGWAYGSHGDALHGKELIIAVSPGAVQAKYDSDGFKYTVTDLLRPYQATSNLIGTKYIKPFITYGASSLSDNDIQQRATEYVEYLTADQLDVLGDYE
jgi:putative NADPH-quinone reductase